LHGFALLNFPLHLGVALRDWFSAADLAIKSLKGGWLGESRWLLIDFSGLDVLEFAFSLIFEAVGMAFFALLC
jgi:hypothetical protein